jgi:hypothetical protein
MTPCNVLVIIQTISLNKLFKKKIELFLDSVCVLKLVTLMCNHPTRLWANPSLGGTTRNVILRIS